MKNREKLTQEKISELQGLISSKESSRSEALRAQAVLLINEKISSRQIQFITGFDGKYAFKLLKKYLEKGKSGLLDKRKKRPRALLTRGQRSQIIKILKDDSPRSFGFEENFWTTAILGLLIKEQYNVHYKTKNPMYLLFKDAKFTFHKPDKKYSNRNQETIDKWTEEMTPIVEKAYGEKDTVILAADEMILSTQTTFQKIWLPQGEFPKIDVSNKRARRCIYGFLDIKTGVEYAFKTEKINSEETRNALEKIGNIFKDKKIVLFWDGAPWHNSKLIKDFLSTTKHSFQLFRFPPYAPEENPQEHVWKAGRSNVTHNKFIENIDSASNEFVSYLNNTIFKYSFFSHGVFLA